MQRLSTVVIEILLFVCLTITTIASLPIQDNPLTSSATSEVSLGRQRREIIFRPLFVYKEQEQELEKERRKKQHQHQHQAEQFVQQHLQQQHQNQDSGAYYGRPFYDPYDYSYFGF